MVSVARFGVCFAVDELPLVEIELKKANCTEKALKARDSKMSLEFIQKLLKEATTLQIEKEKQFVNLSCVLVVALPWEERAREILSHEAPISDFEDMTRASENIFAILPSLNDVNNALLEANSWLCNTKLYLVSPICASNSSRKLEDLQMLVSQSKLLKISLEERRMLELVLKNCKIWEHEACSLLDDARCLFELDNTVHVNSSGLMSKKSKKLSSSIPELSYLYVIVGLKGEDLDLPSGNSRQWNSQSTLPKNQPLTWYKVVKVLKGMGGAGCIPDFNSYGIVIGALCKVGKTVEEYCWHSNYCI
ncbi:hypothetical protein RIF29_34347 [Crotalaria pallida]|uniref:Lysine-specific demethylase-like domain-containing protein n=1 Tax=Crotalaria pallida TaxID=3830 RepID=A0AAN9E9B8_CROPI